MILQSASNGETQTYILRSKKLPGLSTPSNNGCRYIQLGPLPLREIPIMHLYGPFQKPSRGLRNPWHLLSDKRD
jgi:hypothetical protein